MRVRVVAFASSYLREDSLYHSNLAASQRKSVRNPRYILTNVKIVDKFLSEDTKDRKQLNSFEVLATNSISKWLVRSNKE